MVKLLSVMLLFVIYYCLLNICEGILMSASPMAARCQHACKRFTLSVQLYCFAAHKNSSRQSIPMLYAKKNVTKAHTLLYTAVHGLPF